MDLKDEVCSVEYAKKLRELGVKDFTPFQWVEVPATYSISPDLVKTITSSEIKLVFGKYASLEGGYIDRWSAFTVGQLFELLPAVIDTQIEAPFNNYWLHLNKRTFEDIKFIAGYYCDTYAGDERAEHYGVSPFTSKLLVKEHDSKLADCLAKLLINILENGYIDKMYEEKFG